MGLGDIIDKLVWGDPNERPVETLIAYLQPKGFIEHSQIRFKEAQEFFRVYHDILEAAIVGTYGYPFEQTQKFNENGNLKYEFSGPGININYCAAPWVRLFHSESESKEEDYIGYVSGLSVQQRGIDTEKAGALLRELYDRFLLVYHESNDEFDISLERNIEFPIGDGKILNLREPVLHGRALLEAMNCLPDGGATIYPLKPIPVAFSCNDQISIDFLDAIMRDGIVKFEIKDRRIRVLKEGEENVYLPDTYIKADFTIYHWAHILSVEKRK